MASDVSPRTSAPARTGLAGVVLLGSGVSVALGVYAKVHTPSSRPLFTLGFSGMLQMKAWLAVAAGVLVLVQLVTALWMWARLPGAGPAPPVVAPLHRWSGSVAFALSLPVAFHCLWALGFGSPTPRVILHSVAGCLFYGAYAAKMLGLRVQGLPPRALPVLGGLVLTCFVVLFLTAVLWFFTRSGLPLV